MLSIVCPFYNEEKVVVSFFQELIPILEQTDELFEIVCINDGSQDSTLELLYSEQTMYPQIKIVDFSRNFGKEPALTAGIDLSIGDAVIPIDADLQDPPELILEFVKHWKSGFDAVLAKRSDRSSDSWMKRVSSKLFYKFNNVISDIVIPEDVGDFRLMDRKVVNALKQLPERRRFMKGLFAWVGFKTKTIEYVREERVAGESKFNGWKLWNFALEGITGFSTAPLRVWTYIGTLISLFSLCFALFILMQTLIMGVVTPGFATLIVAVLFIGGIQIMGIGLLGEYIGRIYSETKQRPNYIIRTIDGEVYNEQK